MLVIGVCVVGRWYQTKAIDSTLEKLNHLTVLAANDRASAADDLKSDFDNYAHILQLFLNHNDVEEVKLSLTSLCSAVRYRDAADVLAALDTARAQLHKMRDIDATTIENVL